MKLTNYFLNFDFKGRARRSHYWANMACWIGVYLLLFLVAGVSGLGRNGNFAGGVVGVLIGLLALPIIVAQTIDGLAVVFRRAHDTGRSGWIFLLLFIPFVNFLALYWFLIEDSQQGPNKYGAPVKTFYTPEAAATA